MNDLLDFLNALETTTPPTPDALAEERRRVAQKKAQLVRRVNLGALVVGLIVLALIVGFEVLGADWSVAAVAVVAVAVVVAANATWVWAWVVAAAGVMAATATVAEIVATYVSMSVSFKIEALDDALKSLETQAKKIAQAKAACERFA